MNKNKKLVSLVFPEELIKEPVIYRMAVKYDIIPNIRRAQVTESAGRMVLELEGETGKIEKALSELRSKNIKVEPVEGDIIE